MKRKLLLFSSSLLALGIVPLGCKRSSDQSRAAQAPLVITQDGKITLVSTANLWRASVIYHNPPTNATSAPAK